MDEARQGERAGASESIEPVLRASIPFPNLEDASCYVPGGNGARGSGATWTKPVRVSERVRANQSNQCDRASIPFPISKTRRAMSPAGIEPTFKV
jgi:hypothetical protein